MTWPDGVMRLVLLRHGERVGNARNPLCALIKHLDSVSEEAGARLEVPTGVPVACDLDPDTCAPVAAAAQSLRTASRGGE